jgi:hypothetical protein
MPKTLRINYHQASLEEIEHEFENLGLKFSREDTSDADCMYLDDDFPEFFVVPSEGKFVFQDKASMYAPKHLVNSFASTNPKAEIIAARSGCGNRTSYHSTIADSRVIAIGSPQIQGLGFKIEPQRKEYGEYGSGVIAENNIPVLEKEATGGASAPGHEIDVIDVVEGVVRGEQITVIEVYYTLTQSLVYSTSCAFILEATILYIRK